MRTGGHYGSCERAHYYGRGRGCPRTQTCVRCGFDPRPPAKKVAAPKFSDLRDQPEVSRECREAVLNGEHCGCYRDEGRLCCGCGAELDMRCDGGLVK